MKKTIFLLLFILSTFFLLAGFSKPVPIDPYVCKQDSDCVVKDVRNSCGYYPRCVNKNYQPDANKPLVESMICGSPDITSCKCKNNKCISMQNDAEI